MKKYCFAVILCAFFAAPAFASPGGGDRFAEADTNKDGFLSREEFAAAFPTLKAEAFALIDKDKDGRIAAEEWQGFSSGHGKEGHSGSPMHEKMPPHDGALPVLTPPGK